MNKIQDRILNPLLHKVVLLQKFIGGHERMVSYLAMLICPIITFYLFDLYTHNPFQSMDFKTQVLNIVFYELLGVLLLGIIRYLRIALMLQSSFFMIVGLVNYYVLNFRSAPIMPWDVFSISTAASVADNFNYTLEKETVILLFSFVILIFMESKVKLVLPKRKQPRLMMIAMAVMLLWGYTGLVQNDSFISQFGLYDKLFTPTVMNRRDGNIVAFLMELEYLKVEKPAGYSSEAAAAMLAEYESEEFVSAFAGYEGEETAAALEAQESNKRPNIIVIMDEAFSDLSVLGELNPNKDYMPFIHSLQQGADNTVTGYLHVSVLGGNTANTEFEFLTGHSMAFLPAGSIPYQQYVNDEMDSLPSYLKSLGYRTVAMHPYNAGGWERDSVYPLLGFDEFLSLDDFTGVCKVRNYVADEACFDKIINIFEEKESDDALFLFNVTMQNHSGYDEDFANFDVDISASDASSKRLDRYLSLIKLTDQALEELISYFEQVDEDTIILFFGDHQPAAYVSNPVLRANGKDPDALTDEEILLHYRVPYVIWSNFEIEAGTDNETSSNYLAVDILEYCGLPLPAYQSFLKKLRQTNPVVTGMQVIQNSDADIADEALNAYNRIQYYLMFGNKRSSN